MDERTPRQTVLRLSAAGLFAAICLYVVASSASLGIWTDLGPGPGFFPLCAAVVILLSLGGWIWNYFTPPGEEQGAGSVLGLDADVIESHSAEWADVENGSGAEQVEEGLVPARVRLPVVVLSLVLLTAMLPLLGFQLSMFLFLLFQMRVVGGTRCVVSLLLAAAGSFGVFVLFTGVLGVTLPTAGLEPLGRMGF